LKTFLNIVWHDYYSLSLSAAVEGKDAAKCISLFTSSRLWNSRSFYTNIHSIIFPFFHSPKLPDRVYITKKEKYSFPFWYGKLSL